jgi:hypothetical protein
MKTKEFLISSFISLFNAQNVKFYGHQKDYDIKAVRGRDFGTPFDIQLEVKRKILLIIDVNVEKFKITRFTRLEKYASENNIRFYAWGERGLYNIIDRRGSGRNAKNVNLTELIEFIQKSDKINVNEIKEKTASIIVSTIGNSEFKYLKETFILDDKQLTGELEYDDIDDVFFFRNHTDINSIENRIFRHLLEDDNHSIKTIYRYTTLDNIFLILKNNSLRMNCLVGMNDPTEVNYTESYIFGTNRDYTQAAWQTVDAYNRRFILSCSLKEDDLTQWRLYSDDSKGVCLVFSVDDENSYSRFIIKKISYGKENGFHPELDLIRNIISRLKEELNVSFEFRTLNTWRHFFKPHDYSVEEEVRVLYIQPSGEENNKDWVLTNSNRILNPYVEFKLNDESLPFKLVQVILGPKSPEKEINLKQFEHMIRVLRRKTLPAQTDEGDDFEYLYKLGRVNVSISKIKNYR